MFVQDVFLYLILTRHKLTVRQEKYKISGSMMPIAFHWQDLKKIKSVHLLKKNLLKGTMSQDFFDSGFSINHLPPSPENIIRVHRNTGATLSKLWTMFYVRESTFHQCKMIQAINLRLRCYAGSHIQGPHMTGMGGA
jgi:hypothetical protein